MFALTLQQVLKLFLFMLIGYVLYKKKVLPEETPSILSKLEVNLLLPCITLQTFLEHCTVEKLTSDPQLLLVSLVACSATLILGTVAGRYICKDRYEQNLSIYAMNCPNTGYFGTPLVLALFGGEVLMKMMIFTIPLTIYTYSEGYRLLTDRKGLNFKSFLSPVLVAMVAGAAISLIGIPVPTVLTDVISGCAGCMGPLAMILTGCIFAQFRFRDILRDLHIYIIVFIRMIAIPLLVLGIGFLLKFSRETMVLLAAVFAMPTGLNVIVVPAAFHKDCHLGAGMTFVSNLLGLLTIPLFFALFL